MAEQILVHLFDDDTSPSPAALARLVRAVDAWPGAGGGWRGLRWRGAAGEGAAPAEDVLDGAGVAARCEALDGATHALAATAFDCLRFHSGTAEPGSVGLWAEAEDAPAPGAARMRLRVFTMGPFCAPLEADPSGLEPHVLANLETLTSLLFHLVDACAPRRLRVATEGAGPSCLDAHLAWYADEQEVVGELRALLDAPPDTLHPRRPPAEAEALAAALRARVAKAPEPDPETVRGVLRSGAHDVYELDRGFAVLEHPWFLNAFLDRFHLACLDAAGAAPAR